MAKRTPLTPTASTHIIMTYLAKRHTRNSSIIAAINTIRPMLRARITTTCPWLDADSPKFKPSIDDNDDCAEALRNITLDYKLMSHSRTNQKDNYSIIFDQDFSIISGMKGPLSESIQYIIPLYTRLNAFNPRKYGRLVPKRRKALMRVLLCGLFPPTRWSRYRYF